MRFLLRSILLPCLLLGTCLTLRAADLPVETHSFLEQHCFECHDSDSKKGGLDLTALKFNLDQPVNFTKWVLVHDRVSKSEMPPKKHQPAPAPTEVSLFTSALSNSLVTVEQPKLAREGRAT